MFCRLLIILILNLSYIYQYRGLIHKKNFRNRQKSTLLGAVDDVTSYSLYSSALEFLGTNPLELLELTIAPIIILANQFKSSKDIEIMNTKYQQLELSINKTNEELKSFPADMNGAIEAYKVLYDSVNTKLTKMSSNDINRSDFERNIVKSIETINLMVTDEIMTLRKDNNNKLEQQQLQTDMKLNNFQSEYIKISKQLQNTDTIITKDQFISHILQELTSIDSELNMKMRVLLNSNNNNSFINDISGNEVNHSVNDTLAPLISKIDLKIKQLEDRLSDNDGAITELPNAETIDVLRSQLDRLDTKLTDTLKQSKDLMDSLQQQNIDTIKKELQYYELQSNVKYDNTNKELKKLLDTIKYFETLQEQQANGNTELRNSLSKFEEQSLNKFETLKTSLHEQNIRDANVISSLNTSLQTSLQDIIQFKEQLRNSNMDLDDISERIDGEQRQLSMRYKALEEQISSITDNLINVSNDINNFKKEVSILNEGLATGLSLVSSEISNLVTDTKYTKSGLSALEESVAESNKENKQSMDELKSNTNRSIESLKTIIKNENEFLEGRVQMQLSNIKKTTKSIEKDIVEKINIVDTSLETRIENVLEYHSLPSRINRRVKNISAGTKDIARKLKNNIKSTAINIRKKLLSAKSATTNLEQLLADEDRYTSRENNDIESEYQ